MAGPCATGGSSPERPVHQVERRTYSLDAVPVDRRQQVHEAFRNLVADGWLGHVLGQGDRYILPGLVDLRVQGLQLDTERAPRDPERVESLSDPPSEGEHADDDHRRPGKRRGHPPGEFHPAHPRLLAALRQSWRPAKYRRRPTSSCMSQSAGSELSRNPVMGDERGTHLAILAWAPGLVSRRSPSPAKLSAPAPDWFDTYQSDLLLRRDLQPYAVIRAAQ
jgi:hypothetical protein